MLNSGNAPGRLKKQLSRNSLYDSEQLLPEAATQVFYKKAVLKNFAI